MNIQHTIRALALAAMLGTSACTTVVKEKEPVTTSTTTTEESTTVHPLRGASSPAAGPATYMWRNQWISIRPIQATKASNASSITSPSVRPERFGT